MFWGCVAGSVSGSPVLSEKAEPCLGHSISHSSAQTSPSASDASAWEQRSSRAYQSSPMRTTARRQPSLSTRMADPGATSPTLHTTISATAGLRDLVGVAAAAGVELPGDGGPQPLLGAGAERQAVDGVLEEAEDDQALGDVGRHAPGGEVVELVRLDRADGRGVGAADVVALDLQVRDRVGLGPFGEDEVAVGLRGVGPDRRGP